MATTTLTTPRAPRARKGSIPERLVHEHRLLKREARPAASWPDESKSVPRVSGGVIPRFPTLPDHLFTAWCRALVVLIFAKMSWCSEIRGLSEYEYPSTTS